MKKTTIYILVVLLVLMLAGAAMLYKPVETFDKKVTLSRKETRPYGTKICFTTLPLMFDKSKMEINRKSPSDWYIHDSIKDGCNLFFLISRQFNPSKDELDWLYSFVEKGNDVFICSPEINEETQDYFNIKLDYSNIFGDEKDDDSVKVKLIPPHYTFDSSYFNAGFTTGKYVTSYDTNYFKPLGVNHYNHANFIKASVNKGAFFFHTDPFLFANYFLVQPHNDEYFEKVISAIPKDVNKIIWDEYFVYKANENDKKNHSPLRVLLKYPAFVWALMLGLILAIIYFVIYIKRKQRFIPAAKNLRNDSLYFAETIGRLYFEKGDHANLAKKMAAYFLEHIRSKYFINTSQLNNELVSKLSAKSGFAEDETYKLIQTVVDIQAQANISQEQLNKYYLIFQNFYKKTT